MGQLIQFSTKQHTKDMHKLKMVAEKRKRREQSQHSYIIKEGRNSLNQKDNEG